MKITATLDILMRDLPKILRAGVEVAEVEVGDKEPARWPTDDGPEFYLEENWWGDESHGIRQHLWEYVKDSEGTAGKECDNLIYNTEAEARKALSDAVIAWAKQQTASEQEQA